MRIKGIVYLHTSMGWFKKDFDRIENELRMMRDELHANAVRLEGIGITLWKIIEIAMNEGLQVWAHPKVDGVVPRSKFVNIYI